MNEDLARVIAAASVGATVLGIGVAVLFSTRESRVRLPIDILMVWITAGALAGVAIVTGVHTDPLLAAGAGTLGFILGTAQGTQLRVRRDGDRVFARRGAIALAAWGAGLITIQTASLASREGVVEIGQAVSYFGVGGAFGLIVGRETAIRRLAPVGAAALAVFALGVPLSHQRPATAQEQPRPITITLEIDSRHLLTALGIGPSEQLGALGTAQTTEMDVTFPSGGGPASGEGDAVIPDFYLGLFIHAIELLAAEIGGTVGDIISGSDPNAPQDPERPIRDELRDCRAQLRLAISVGGSYDPATGRVEGPATGTLYIEDGRNCPSDIELAGAVSDLTGTWGATYSGGEANGAITLNPVDGGAGVTFFFTGSEATADDTPPEDDDNSPASSDSGDPEASPEDPANTEGEDPEAEDGEIPPPVIAPPVTLDEIGPEEAAGVGIIGAGAAGLVGLASAASAAASAPAGAPVGVFEQPEAKKPEDDEEEGPRERKQDDIDPEDVDQAAENIIRIAGKENYEDILRAVRSRMENGTIDAATLETLRQILKDRMAIDAALASSDLMNKPDWQAFLEGFREDLARLADLYGMGIVVRDPLLVTRILAAVHTAGASEVVFFPAQVAGALWDRANSPGQDIRSTADAAKEVARVIGTEVASEVASELIGAGIIRGGGAALDAIRGAGKGVDLTDLARGVPGGSIDEALEGAARGLPPAGTIDEALEGAARGTPPASSLDEALEGGMRPSALDEASGARPPTDPYAPIPEDEIAPFRPQDMENSPISRWDETHGPAPTREVPTRPGVPRDMEPTVYDPDAGLSRSVIPKPDDSFVRNAPNGTRIPDSELAGTGYTQGQLDDLHKIANENGVLIGNRATNIASPHHLGNPDVVPKPLPVKQKTTGPVDLFIGGRPENEGLVSVFRPTPPKPSDFRNAADYQEALGRYAQRADEFNKTMKQLPELEKQGITWDPDTGLIKLNGKKLAGDIDGVYVRDATTGQFLGPGNPKYDKVIEALQNSRVQGQHGMETGIAVDVTDMKGMGAYDAAVDAHTALSRNHELGREILIEVGPDGFQKGPRAFGVYDQLHPEESALRRGLPMALPE